jgi:hypothetical protein
MSQSNNVTFDGSGKVLFVHNQICLKSECKSTKMYKLKSSQEQNHLKKQILVPSFLFNQFETKSTGEKLVSDDYSNKVALCFQHLTNKTQSYYLEHKVLPDWAELKQQAKKVGKLHAPYPRKGVNYFWFGHKYSRQALYKRNLFKFPPTNSYETVEIASLDVTMTIDVEQVPVLSAGPSTADPIPGPSHSNPGTSYINCVLYYL